MEPQQVIQELLDSNLRGRGGAFFAAGRKASFIPRDAAKPVYLTVNADESEPGTFKDREIMLRVPHRLLEGCLIVAHAIASQHVFSLSGNVVRGGNYELDNGTTLRELIYEVGGGIPDGRRLKAIVPGGSSTPVLTAADVDTPLDYDALAKAGTMFGSGAIIAIDDRC